MTILTTTRPLSNDDRKDIWKDKITSPPQGQPERVSFLSVFQGALGFVLTVATGLAFVGLMGMQAGVW